VASRKSLTGTEDLADFYNSSLSTYQPVIDKYPMRIHPFVSGLISHDPDGPIARQFIPDMQELSDELGSDDPLAENRQSPVKQIVHRYPDRVVFMVSNTCPSFCRFCMRKRFVGKQPQVTQSDIQDGLAYIARTPQIHEVILSGGEPFMQSNACLLDTMAQLKQMTHVNVIRIHTRVPFLMPERLTADLIEKLRKYHPVYINVHVNHASEITPDACRMITQMADAGFPLGSQTVLLKGVNDCPETMLELMKALLPLRIRPYYIHHLDDTQGTRHFQTDIETGLNIMKCLRGQISGMAVPQFMIDLPNGGGKIPMLPDYVKARTPVSWLFWNYAGKLFEWKRPGKKK